MGFSATVFDLKEKKKKKQVLKWFETTVKQTKAEKKLSSSFSSSQVTSQYVHWKHWDRETKRLIFQVVYQIWIQFD